MYIGDKFSFRGSNTSDKEKWYWLQKETCIQANNREIHFEILWLCSLFFFFLGYFGRPSELFLTFCTIPESNQNYPGKHVMT